MIVSFFLAHQLLLLRLTTRSSSLGTPTVRELTDDPPDRLIAAWIIGGIFVIATHILFLYILRRHLNQNPEIRRRNEENDGEEDEEEMAEIFVNTPEAIVQRKVHRSSLLL